MKHQWPQFDPPASMVCVCAQECHVTAAKMIYFTTPKVNVARISPHRYDKKKKNTFENPNLKKLCLKKNIGSDS